MFTRFIGKRSSLFGDGALPEKSRVSTAKKKKSRFDFITGTIGELKKVVWPTRQEALRLTAMVLLVCLAMGIFLGSLDYGLTELVSKVLLGGG